MTEQQGHDRDAIMQHLAGTDLDEIRAAAFAAGEARLSDAVTLLVRHLQSSNIGVQEAAEMALRHIRGKATVRAVLPLLHSENVPVRNSAMDLLRAISPDDMKAISEYMQSPDVDIRIFLADIAGFSNQSVAVTLLSELLLHDPEVNVRYQAAISLGELGFPEAIPALQKALDDEEWVQFSVVEALAKIRAESSVDILLKALPNVTPLVASTIITALGESGTVKAAPILLQQLESITGPLRDKTVIAIIRLLGPQALQLLNAKELSSLRDYLLAAFANTDVDDSDTLEILLQGLTVVGGKESTSAILKLVNALDLDADHELIGKTHMALVSIGCNENLINGLDAKNSEQTLYTSIKACGDIADQTCLDALARAFWNFDRNAQRVAADAILASPLAVDEAFFIKVLDTLNDGHVVKDALRFLGLRVRCTSASGRLLQRLQARELDVKEVALEACLGLQDPATNAELASLFRSAEPLERLMGVYAMAQINPKEYLDDLIEALEDDTPDVRKIALEALGKLCGDMPEIWEVLTPKLYDESREVRLAVIDLLGAVDVPENIEALLKALDDADIWVVVRAVEALGHLGDPLVLPRLITMLEQPDVLLQIKIVEALGEIGGKTAFKALLSLTNHEDPDVQQAVSLALDNLRDGEDF